MYDSYYNLETLPFENTPDPRFFYASEQHREALAAIEYTIRMRKGIVLITGDIGSGKTTIGRTMLQRCCDRATILQLFHGHSSGPELLRHILRNMKQPLSGEHDHAYLLERLNIILQQHSSSGKPVVLFIDEAQTLSDNALEELRLISNFDTNTTKLLQLVLVGQPELRDRISTTALSALRQRIVMAKRLRPLNIQDTAGYVCHRIRAASWDKENIKVSFNTDAVETLFNNTQGIPRLINIVCDNCLLLGFVKQVQRITASMVRQVLDDMIPCFDIPITQGINSELTYRAAGNF